MSAVGEANERREVSSAMAAVESRFDSLWKAIAAADRISAIEYFLAAGAHQSGYKPGRDGDPRRTVERLAKRLNMRALFLLGDRRRAAKMLEQYGHRLLGSMFTLRAARAYLKQHHLDALLAVETAIDEIDSARQVDTDWQMEEIESVLAYVRTGLGVEIPDVVWELMVRVANTDPEWQVLVSTIFGEAEAANSVGGGGGAAVPPAMALEEAGSEPVIEVEGSAEIGEVAVVVASSPPPATEVATAAVEGPSGAVKSAQAARSETDIGEIEVAAATVADEQEGLAESFEEEADEYEFRQPQHTLTGLDRAIIDFILGAATETPGSGSPDEVLKVCDEWSRLSTHRIQSYYVLGLAHGLLDNSVDGFARTEMNEARNAWYAAGHIAAIQRRQDRDALTLFLAERGKALSALLGSQAADPQEGTRGAARQLLRQSMDFLADCNGWAAIASITRCAGPYLDMRLLENLYRHTSELVATQRPMEAEALMGVVLAEEVRCPGELHVRFRRRRAQVMAQQGKLAAARDEFENLTDCGYADVEARAVIDVSLLKAGLTSAAQIHLPEGATSRREVLQRFCLVTDAVEFALTAIPEDGGAVARADGLAFLAVVAYLRWAGHAADKSRPSSEATLQAVEAALLAIPRANAENQYRLGGTLGLLLTIEATLSFERSDVARGLAAWKRVPHETGRLPLDDLYVLVETAMIVDPASAEWIVDSILRHRPVLEVRRPDTEWLAASGNLRRSHLESIETLILTNAEKLELYDRLLEAARKAADRPIALKCLDAVYRLGVFEEQAEVVLERFLRSRSWEGLWSRAEASEAIADLCVRRKRKDEALLYLGDSFEAAMLDGDLDYGSALLARMQEIGLPDVEYNARAGRLPGPGPKTETLSGSITKHVGRPVRIAFVGGDERQAQYNDELRALLREEFEDLLQVEFIHPGWSSNWGRSVDDVLRQCESRDAVVLMRFMRTLMGRTLREGLTKPWVSCAGHGRKAMHLAILQAVQVVVRQKARHG